MVKLMERGVNVCLGTDSLASTDSLSMFDEMRQMARRAPWLNAVEVLRMGTENGARALGMNAGKIEVGALADLIALPYRGASKEVYEAVLDYREPVAWMMLNGQPSPAQ